MLYFLNSMNFIGTKDLTTDRLILRRWKSSDYLSMYENYAKKEVVTRYLTWFPYSDPLKCKEFIENYYLPYDDEKFIWAITLKENSENVIGSIDICSLFKDEEKGEIGYCLSDEYWNKGIMSEALKAVTKYLFEEVRFKTIIIKCMKENSASYKVMQKNGYKFKGISKTFSEKLNKEIETINTELTLSEYLIK